MSTMPMPDMGDPGDESDSQDSGYEECEQRIAALEQWATQVGQKVGVPFSAAGGDEEDPLTQSLAMTKGALGS